MTQYLGVKEHYPDSILFYRMGDFYEMFFDDAVKASELLEITLTSRDKKSESPIPMCGFPAKAADTYIAKLISCGEKVAVCEQVEDPSVAKGIVKREVTRVITPGMILDNTLLDEKSNNYIVSLAKKNGTSGLAYLDISTGAFRVSESSDFNAIIDESLKVSPGELLVTEAFKEDPAFSGLLDTFADTSVTFIDDNEFDYKKGRKKLTDHFNTRSLEGFGCNNLKACVSAAGALLTYVQDTQFQQIEHLSPPETYTLSDYLVIDDSSCRNLELTNNIRTGTRLGTLLSVMDKTVTAMGGRLLKEWIKSPLLDPETINQRLDAVTEAKTNIPLRQSIRQNLKSVSDLERLISKISMGQSNARDLVALRSSLSVLPGIWSELSEFESGLFNSDQTIELFIKLEALLSASINDDPPPTLTEGNIIKKGYDADLDELIKLSMDGKSWIAELEVSERKKTGISTLKVKFNKVFGYFIEVSKAQSKEVPETYIRKQTLVNAERFITEDLKNFETRVMEAEDKRSSLEYEIYTRIKDAVVENGTAVLEAARHLANADCLLTLAEIADHNNYCRPEINKKGHISITDGRHPVVEKMIDGERYVPNTVKLDNDANQVLIITGPNMAGKSTILRQVALMSIMAQAGSFVPADSASICITDRIFTRVGALDNLSQGQSTFMVEMEETANIMNNATPDSLIIMDEIGRGTSTFDGLSIAWAVAEYLHDLKDKGVKTLFATHYHELTELAESKKRVRNFNIAVKEWNDNIIFLRKLVEGGTNRSYGIQVARLAGVPQSIIGRAKRVLMSIENDANGHSRKLGSKIDKKKKSRKKKAPVQLSLFKEPGNPVMETLQNIEISSMTPLEALNLLNELKAQAKDFEEDGY